MEVEFGWPRQPGPVLHQEWAVLGVTALVERCDARYVVRSQADLERLLLRAYGAGVSLERAMSGFRFVATALGDRNLCLAQIAAVHLRLPDLPDAKARCNLEAEDRLIKTERSDSRLDRSAWDETKHPRAGVPPNPGWFAPLSAGEAPTQIAQNEEERVPEEVLDPAAPLRQAQWDANIATLREIDPNNPNLRYFANPARRPAKERSTASMQQSSPRRSSG